MIRPRLVRSNGGGSNFLATKLLSEWRSRMGGVGEEGQVEGEGEQPGLSILPAAADVKIVLAPAASAPAATAAALSAAVVDIKSNVLDDSAAIRLRYIFSERSREKDAARMAVLTTLAKEILSRMPIRTAVALQLKEHGIPSADDVNWTDAVWIYGLELYLTSRGICLPSLSVPPPSIIKKFDAGKLVASGDISMTQAELIRIKLFFERRAALMATEADYISKLKEAVVQHSAVSSSLSSWRAKYMQGPTPYPANVQSEADRLARLIKTYDDTLAIWTRRLEPVDAEIKTLNLKVKTLLATYPKLRSIVQNLLATRSPGDAQVSADASWNNMVWIRGISMFLNELQLCSC